MTSLNKIILRFFNMQSCVVIAIRGKLTCFLGFLSACVWRLNMLFKVSKKVGLRLFALFRSSKPNQLFLQICQNLCGILIILRWLLWSRIGGYCRRESKLRHLIFVHNLGGWLTGGRTCSFVSCRLDLGGSDFGGVRNLVLWWRFHFKSLLSCQII